MGGTEPNAKTIEDELTKLRANLTQLAMDVGKLAEHLADQDPSK